MNLTGAPKTKDEMLEQAYKLANPDAGRLFLALVAFDERTERDAKSLALAAALGISPERLTRAWRDLAAVGIAQELVRA